MNVSKKSGQVRIGAIFIIAIVISIISGMWITKFFNDNESVGHVENVSISILSSNFTISYENISTYNITVADLLFECAEKNNLTIKRDYWKGYDSYFVEAINNIENGNDDKYWQYYINGKFADIGCSKYILNNNDIVEWRFESSQWS